MKNFLIALCLLPCLASGQVTDTLFANENYNTAIFFPEEIRQGVVGSQNYIFSYNEAHPQKFGLLKAIPGPPSNLFVVTTDGTCYSFMISYKKDPARLSYFIEASQHLSQGTTPAVKPPHSPKRGPVIDTAGIFPRSLKYLKEFRKPFRRKKKEGIILQVNKVIYHKGKVYMVMAITNNSGISFEPEFLRVFHVSGNNRRSASYQRLPLEPLWTFRFPEKVAQGRQVGFVFVFSKFVLGRKEKLALVLREKNGNRSLKMPLRNLD